MGAPRNFGIWDGVFLWALLSNLNRSGAADFFHNHQSDPGYRQWRSEADRLAADNATLRRRLEDLDRQLNERRGQRTDANYLPPGVPAGVAYATQTSDRTPSVADGDDGSGMTVWVIVALVAGGAIVGWLLWQRLSRRDGGGSMRNLGTAGAMLRQKLSNDPYRPDHFRVGMTFAFDPTPFVLLAGMTKVASPATDTGSQRLTATAIGTVTGGGVQLLRLYLPDERSVFQLHLDPTGSPDECRFFSTIDIVTPADQSEWGVWLDAREGMIGWPQFQTKDGKLYNRVWTPGSERVPPMEMTEAIESAGLPPRQIRRQSMLYATASGATAPAPDTEYILVSAVEDGRGAWVEIAAGIDVNPSMLELS